MSRPLIAIVGAGQIGGTIAHLLSSRDFADLVLIGNTEGRAEAKALDLRQSAAVHGREASIRGVTGDFSAIARADICIVAAGVAQLPGAGREGLAGVNLGIIREIARAVSREAPNAFVICVTNPVDAMTWAFAEYSRLPSRRIVGMSGVLDGARFARFLADSLGVAVGDVQAIVLGAHSDLMVPLPRHTAVQGITVAELVRSGRLTNAALEAVLSRTRRAGPEIAALRKGSGAVFGPAEAATRLVRMYLGDEKKLALCSARLSGEYGVNGAFMGVPAVIGAAGVEAVVELELDSGESSALAKSVESVEAMVRTCRALDPGLDVSRR